MTSSELNSEVAGHRIVALDSVRGFAILGILLLNISSFALPYAAYMNLFYKEDVLFSDVLTWSALSTFAQGKFLFILTLLFGASLELLRQREHNWNLCRLLILSVIGLLHGILLWDGDILLSYGLAGIFALHLINTRHNLFGQGVVFYLFGLMMFYLLGLFPVEENSTFWRPLEQDIFHEVYWKTHGGLLAIEHRMRQVSGAMIVTAVQYGWQMVGTMLCGAMLVRNGWLKGAYSSYHYRRMALWLFVVGLVIHAVALLVQYLYPYSYFTALTVRHTIAELATPFLALAYVALIYGFWPVISRCRVIFWFQQVGRMPLTCYLMQTLICTVLFYHWELFNQFTRLELLIFVPFVWGGNIGFACWWLKYHQKGPIETLWRGLSGKLVERF
ncbi:DUF418 domain-containing protein YeiB [Xenorhabdus cabanillasii]|uniref:DUF418 domain-containing protein n=1 Tax=Xenorhabdus cabanillasii JM26 TaxID=1427517 RepID=W1J749_9GAMM|nr:DUF418 domain-containing protein YeiB [Xenorhabdus cabanillasii]PHM78547.1 membrane protein [Xenorhabdus cabanillasii JM26]CDL85858.1 conserved membrane hypothetical protein [Xenorhabdus cabanillasii JM26]